jgi:hypothetical protein
MKKSHKRDISGSLRPTLVKEKEFLRATATIECLSHVLCCNKLNPLLYGLQGPIKISNLLSKVHVELRDTWSYVHSIRNAGSGFI